MVEPILKQLFQRLPKRTREVLVRRVGLKNNRPETLEAIGRDFGVTRERVRQVEESGVRLMRSNGLPAEMKEFEAAIVRHLENFNGVREEGRLLPELKFIFNDRHPASPSRIKFLLGLSEKFVYVPETAKYCAFWADSPESAKIVLKFIDFLVKEMRKSRQPISVDELESFVKKVSLAALAKSLSSGILLSYFSLSRELALNPFGEFGLTSWSEIVPKGVRDRAYRVIRQQRRPIHFRELASLLNGHAQLASNFHPAWQKDIETQTVHNELIKDPNFVLVGRGFYALKEWGYEAGTVKDVLASIIRKSKRPLAKNELISQVKAQRLVQENTILINLQDRRIFERLHDGRYRLRRLGPRGRQGGRLEA